ncbi:CPXCG motif-containing cysteine-rich protein [Echinicola shivajiensis]|uniref:CPXCG motif-containing cysteine-rich protein n=1 Tax=Echinicola shivajiensis TaxID=1035916 RepID=UPI001BFC6458|nr:CPXCG motif-containing cysteine-rich protein [Echinicola shivajiensis]
MLSKEKFFTCPHCLSHISMILDLSISSQKYIEDCEVCCQPIEVNFTIENGEITNFTTSPIEQ